MTISITDTHVTVNGTSHLITDSAACSQLYRALNIGGTKTLRRRLESIEDCNQCEVELAAYETIVSTLEGTKYPVTGALEEIAGKRRQIERKRRRFS